MHAPPQAAARLPNPAAFAHVKTWVFDLDNTLYPVGAGPYPQVDRRIRDYIGRALGLDEEQAYRRQKRYFRTYGTSLLGMTREHGTDPKDFLAYVHDVDVTCIPQDPQLADALAHLDGRKIVFTNADTAYAERVLARVGIRFHFDAIFDIEAAGYLPKPHQVSYEKMLNTHGVDPATAVMVEDLPRNLVPAAALGMTTVWVKNDGRWALADERREELMRQFGEDGKAAHYVADHLASWLRAAAGASAAD